ncbi:phospholipase A [Chitinibacter tainanensis]|uniref:phospholipase A n=1 Tax=Chitinibacter tainanensis TaxID=230667 RepID=UPI002354B9BD|nr:phospholipase A [Chitinibacter tainanensis]
MFKLRTLSWLFLLSGAAHAADLASCQSIADNHARLACYDQLARNVSPVATPAETSTSSATVAAAPTEPSIPSTTNTVSPVAATTLASGDAFSQRWELDAADQKGVFTIRPHQPVYFLPFSWRENVNTQPCSLNPRNCAKRSADSFKNLEAKFQLSFKTKFWEDMLGSPIDLWGAYTQQSYWQVYDQETSAPFRETDYQPEIWATLPLALGPDWLRLRMLNLGLVHQSNGQTLPLSRSWNRLYASVGLSSGDLSVIIKPWWRLKEDPADDDNPAITDYSGRMETLLTYPWGKHQFALTWRNNLKFNSSVPNRSYWLLEWAFPLAGQLHGYVQAFDGYGDSLQNYNFKNRGVALGVSLVKWQ